MAASGKRQTGRTGLFSDFCIGNGFANQPLQSSSAKISDIPFIIAENFFVFDYLMEVADKHIPMKLYKIFGKVFWGQNEKSQTTPQKKLHLEFESA